MLTIFACLDNANNNLSKKPAANHAKETTGCSRVLFKLFSDEQVKKNSEACVQKHVAPKRPTIAVLSLRSESMLHVNDDTCGDCSNKVTLEKTEVHLMDFNGVYVTLLY